MDYIKHIIDFVPSNEQEIQDKKIILEYIDKFPHNILLRDNEFAHITSSGFIMNPELDKVLMIHHNIRNTWAWTGGHADGDTDFLHVAIKEAKEETGIKEVRVLTDDIVSIDVLPVFGHVKRNKYVSAHLHLSIAYILIASEKETLIIKDDENSGVKWLSINKFTENHFDASDVYLYNKLINRAKQIYYNNVNFRKKVLELLKKNEALNANIINFIESYPAHHMEIIGESVFIKGISDRKWVYISSKSSAELKIIKNKLDIDDKCFAIIEDWMLPILTKGNNIKWKLSTMKLVLPSNETMPSILSNISKLTIEDSKFIYDNSDYKAYVSIEYISQRIRDGISSCVRIDNKLAAWGITQDDGAIGFLHVLPEYRRKRYGRDITVDLINKVRKAGKIPFVHIEENNTNSMSMAIGLGFRKDRIVNWFEIE